MGQLNLTVATTDDPLASRQPDHDLSQDHIVADEDRPGDEQPPRPPLVQVKVSGRQAPTCPMRPAR
jgi:hypothetical protein